MAKFYENCRSVRLNYALAEAICDSVDFIDHHGPGYEIVKF